MTTLDTFLWVILPYLSIAIMAVGFVWRYRTDQFGWTSRSSEWNENRILRWSSPLFHIGILCVAGGHVVGLAVPKSWTQAAGVSQHMYHLGATGLGSLAALATITGLAGLIWRRVVVKSVRLATSRMDIVTYAMLCLPIGLGTWATVSSQVLGGHEGYDYRETVSVWFRSIPALHTRAPNSCSTFPCRSSCTSWRACSCSASGLSRVSSTPCRRPSATSPARTSSTGRATAGSRRPNPAAGETAVRPAFAHERTGPNPRLRRRCAAFAPPSTRAHRPRTAAVRPGRRLRQRPGAGSRPRASGARRRGSASAEHRAKPGARQAVQSFVVQTRV